jgi:integrase/recombinase XerD
MTLLKAYLEDLTLRHCAPSTKASARTTLPVFLKHLRGLGVRDVRRLTEEHVVSFARSLASTKRKDGKLLALGTQAQYLGVVKAFCGFLKRSGRLLEDPAHRVPLPLRKRLPRALNEPDACRLMSVPDSRTPFGLRDRAILELLYGTGLRMTECTQLDLGDLDLAQGILMVRSGKNRKDRLLPIPGRARAALEAYLQAGRPELVRPAQEPAAFLSRYGSRLSNVGLRLVVRAHGRSIGVSVSCHVLRHSCATHLLAGGADVREIQRLLGHENLKTTALYTKVDLRALRKMIQACHPRERVDQSCPTASRA